MPGPWPAVRGRRLPAHQQVHLQAEEATAASHHVDATACKSFSQLTAAATKLAEITSIDNQDWSDTHVQSCCCANYKAQIHPHGGV